MRNSFLLVLFLGIAFQATAQFTFKGVIIDTKEAPVAGAVIAIDGTFLATTSKSDGTFQLSGLKSPEVAFTVKLLGFLPYSKRIDLNKESSITIRLDAQSYLADEVVIQATRADERSAMTYTTLTKKEIKDQNLGQDIPFLLNTQPSVVVNSDAGAGIGYTGIRVRGSDATRINVTVNGIPINDAEAHGLFWVNMPDFASSVNSIQLQRGVGTSTNGAGAFGATLNMQTNDFNGKAYGRYTGSAGSFNTLRNTFEVGTGLINGFTFDARLSQIQSDGFIDRANSNLSSFFLSGGWYKNKTSIRANIFSGKEKTYQAWYGVPQDSLKTNSTYNPAGIYFDADGKEQFYDNETDNYQQDHYQLFFSHQQSKWLFNLAFHYTIGRGYYEQYRQADDLSSYGLNPVFLGSQTVLVNGDTLVVPADSITTTDLIRQRWLDNKFYGTVASVTFTPNNRFRLIIGGGANRYDGDHFGDVIRAGAGFPVDKPYRYYEDNAVKTDMNGYVKANYSIGKKWDLFADMQVRHIDYSFLGFNNNLQSVQQEVKLNFFNPKAGLTYIANERNRAFLSWSVGNREPVRDDFTNSTPNTRPKPEQLQDVELGYRYAGKRVQWGATFYNMSYKNQLVLTGAINDVGAYNRVNIAESYRRGIELEAAWNINKQWLLSGNLALSENKIKEFTEYVDDYDTGSQILIAHKNTDISFSPAAIASGILAFKPMSGLSLQWITKYVGKQFLDNTSSEDRLLDAFFTCDARLNWTLEFPKQPKIDLGFQVNNIFSAFYTPNGYTYSGFSGGQRYDYNYYFPQAGINFLGMIRLNF